MTFNFTNPVAKFSATPATEKTYIKQFNRTAAGILSIALLSSTMVVATVSASSAKEVEHVSESDLKGMCARSKGRFSGSKGSGIYSCVVDHADGSHTDVSCDKEECEGVVYKKIKRGSPIIKVDLCTRTTLGELDPIIPILCKFKTKGGSLLQK
jgi:hypothetical protein